MQRICSLDFNDPIMGRECILDATCIMRVLVVQGAVEIADGWKTVKVLHSGLLGFVADRRNYETGEDILPFHRDYQMRFREGTGITLIEVLEKGDWTLQRER